MAASHNSAPIDPRIGILGHGDQIRFYAFVDGYDAPELQGTREEIEAALGLRDATADPIVQKEAAKRVQHLSLYRARLTSPSGETFEYEATAENKSAARTANRRLFRIDVPSPKNGFYSFEQCRLDWIEIEG